MAVRCASESDAASIANLVVQLGYDGDVADLTERLAAVHSNPEHAVFVFDHSSEGVVGWVHVCCTLRIESPRFAEIGGLVVDERFRRQGIATALIAAGEKWAQQMGLAKLRVRCNQLRDDAVLFYRRTGFEPVKTQAVLDRAVMHELPLDATRSTRSGR